MSDEQATISEKIKRLKRGKSFKVTTPDERVQALKSAKTLRDAKVIDFQVITKKTDGGFIVAAI